MNPYLEKISCLLRVVDTCNQRAGKCLRTGRNFAIAALLIGVVPSAALAAFLLTQGPQWDSCLVLGISALISFSMIPVVLREWQMASQKWLILRHDALNEINNLRERSKKWIFDELNEENE